MKRKSSIVMMCLLCVMASTSFARGLSDLIKAPKNNSIDQIVYGDSVARGFGGCFSECLEERNECIAELPEGASGIGDSGVGAGGSMLQCIDGFYECLDARCS